MDAAKAKSLGAANKDLGRLKAGEDLEVDGKMIRSADVVAPPVPGRHVAVLQDTSDASAAADACRGAAVVIHEATFEAALQEQAIAKGHSTSAMAGAFAARVGCARLVTESGRRLSGAAS